MITEPDATKTTKNGSNERNNKADNNHHHHHHSHPKDTVKRNFIRQKTNLMLGDTTPAMTCPICLNEFSEGDIICWSHNPSCNHTFHMDCIEHWLLKHDRCPCCRNDYLTPAAAAAAAVDLPPPSNESRRRHLLLQLANALVERMNRSPSGSHHSNSGRLPSSGHDRNPSDDLPSSRSDSERTTCISEEEGRHEQDPCCDIETGLCECRTSSAEDQ